MAIPMPKSTSQASAPSWIRFNEVARLVYRPIHPDPMDYPKLVEEERDRSPVAITGFVSGSRQRRDVSSQTGYIERDTTRYAPSPSSGARSTSRSLSQPRGYHGVQRGSILDRSHFVGAVLLAFRDPR
ncbi:hypothetical protein FRC08_010081 [Ceratobasidium sp. 394]|nr:hypothetical protein FRC08_010081 [Ceratobasidium sp. 394]KAG9096447.1 hypothetical protein FS749_008473 [Ceratobasidium sp. UAMH 11750]